MEYCWSWLCCGNCSKRTSKKTMAAGRRRTCPYGQPTWLRGIGSCLERWRPLAEKLLDVLHYNKQMAVDAVEKIQDVSCIPPHATYLLWVDCTEWITHRPPGQNRPQKTCEAAGIGLSNGADFGSPNFLRLNFGCPPALLQEGLRRLQNAFG